MSKNKKLSKQQIQAHQYIQLRDFLLYDPHYNKLSDRAKILYSHLLNKISLFAKRQELYEMGEGSKSYCDDEGNLFIIADNVELMYILNCSEPTAIKAKEELEAYDLLLQEEVKDQANRLYVLEPIDLADRNEYIQEIIKLRAEKKQADKEKREAEKKKKAAAKKEKKAKKLAKKKEKVLSKKAAKSSDLKDLSHKKEAEIGDLKKLSHGEKNDLSHGEYKNLSKSNTKGFKSLPNTFKSNLSISKYDFDPKTEKILLQREDRLTDYILKGINELYQAFNYDLERFHRILGAAMVDAKYIVAYMKTSLKNPDKETAAAAPGKATREEQVPEWLKERKQGQAAADNQDLDEATAAQIAELQAKLKGKYNQKRA